MSGKKKIFRPAYVNSLDPWVPEIWARETLSILFDELVMANLVHRDFENEVAEAGDVVNTRRPAKFAAKRKATNDDITVQDAVATNVPVPLNQHWHTSFLIRDREQSLSFANLVERYLLPAVRSIAEEVDKLLLGQLYQYYDTSGGSLGTPITSIDPVLEIRRKQNELNVPMMGRNLVIPPTIDESLLKLDTFHEADKVGDDGTALREALLGRKLGYNFYMSNLVPQVVGGSAVASETGAIDNVGGYSAGTTGSLTVDGFTGARGVGSWLTLGGKPYRVAAETAAPDTTAITLDRALETDVLDDAPIVSYTPGAVDEAADYAAGWEKEVHVDGMTVAPQVGQAISFGLSATSAVYTILQSTNTAGNDYDLLLDRPLEVGLSNDDAANLGPAGDHGFAFVRNAIALVSRPLALTAAGLGPQTAVVFHDGLGIRVTLTYDARGQGILVTVDLLCGVAKLYDELGAVLLG